MVQNLKARTQSPFERCDLVSVKLDFVQEIFQSLCKRSDDINMRLIKVIM